MIVMKAVSQDGCALEFASKDYAGSGAASTASGNLDLFLRVLPLFAL